MNQEKAPSEHSKASLIGDKNIEFEAGDANVPVDEEKKDEVELVPVKDAMVVDFKNKVQPLDGHNMTFKEVNKNNSPGLEMNLMKPKRFKTVAMNLAKGDTLTNNDESQMKQFNLEKRLNLGNLSLQDLYKSGMPSGSAQKMLMQAKVAAEIRKLNNDINENEASDSDFEQYDDPNIMEEFDPGAKDQKQNKNIFRRNYGVEKQLPGLYILDAKIYPINLDYVVRLVKYVIPDNSVYKIKTFDQNKPEMVGEIQEINQVYNDEKFESGKVVIQLMKFDGNNNLDLIEEIPYLSKTKIEINFSSNGQYFTIINKKDSDFKIFKLKTNNNEGIKDLINKIKNNKIYKNYRDFTGQNVIFDKNNRFVAIYGKKTIYFYNLKQNLDKEDDLCCQEHYEVPDKFEFILNLQLVSSNEKEFRCDIACKVQGQKQILIFTKDEGSHDSQASLSQFENGRQILYTKDSKKIIKVKISDNFEKVVFASEFESFVLKKDQHGGFTQQIISWVKNKVISHIIPSKDEFLLVCHKHFDKDLDVEHSLDEQFKIRIPAIIANGHTILDALQIDVNHEGFGERMVIITKVDSNLHYHLVSPQIQRKNKNYEMSTNSDISTGEVKEESPLLKSTHSGNLNIIYAQWPYVAVTGFDNTIYLFCAFDQEILKRIVLKFDITHQKISQIFITVDNDLFFMMDNFDEDKQELYCINLNNPQNFQNFDDQKIEIQHKFSYQNSEVGNEPLLDIFVRSSSDNQKINLNKKLFVFFLHQTHLYQWNENIEQLKSVSSTTSEKIIENGPEQFLLKNNVKCNDKGITQDQKCNKYQLEILSYHIMFSTYHTDEVYKQIHGQDYKIKGLFIDTLSYKLILMTSLKDNKKKVKLLVIDLHTGKQIASSIVNDSQIIGRVMTGSFSIVDGHMYFDNEVFKLRYDYMHLTKQNQITEEQLIDKYSDLLDLNSGESVKSNMPLISYNCHKQVYIVSNWKHQKAIKLIILPFMHERKIYLNRKKLENQYFYTTIMEDVKQQQDIKINSKQMQSSAGFNKSFNSQKPKNLKNRTSIVILDCTHHKYQVYSEGGLLLKRIDYSKTVEKYGEPVEVSSNGQNFIFQKSDNQNDLHIFELQTNQFKFIKTIQIIGTIQKYLDEVAKSVEEVEFQIKADKLKNNFEANYKSLLITNNADISININDKQDIIIQISNKHENILSKQFQNSFIESDKQYVMQILKAECFKDQNKQMKADLRKKLWKQKNIEIKGLMKKLDPSSREQLNKMQFEFRIRLYQCLNMIQGSIFYIQLGKMQKDQSAKDNILNQQLFYSNDNECGQYFDDFYQENMAMNNKYVVFWNSCQCWYIDINNTQFSDPVNIKSVSLKVDKLEKESFIRKIIVGANDNKIVIIIRQSIQSNMCVLWNVEHNYEEEAFDCDINAGVFFDKNGSPYITNQDSITICDQGVRLKSYDYNRPKEYNDKFGINKGFRFDNINHNWMILDEHISFSFCFMTFVIRDKHQKQIQIDQDEFDIEQFSFNINRKTFLTCDNFVNNDYEILEYVLKNIKNIDPVFIEQLHYYYLDNQDQEHEGEQQQIGLSKSFKVKSLIKNKEEDLDIDQCSSKITPLNLAMENNRSANIILNYMADIDYNGSNTISDIIGDLIDHSSFINYFEQLPFQTIQMQSKQTLLIEESYNDHIVQIQESTSSFVDKYFYKTSMGERNKDSKEAQECQNFPIKMIALRVDWILQDQGKEFLKNLLSTGNDELFECSTTQVIIEFLYKAYKKDMLYVKFPLYCLQVTTYFASVLLSRETHYYYKMTSDYLNIFSICSTMWQMYMNISYTGKSIFFRVWVYFDLLYVALNSYVCFSNLTYNEQDGQKSLENVRLVSAYLSIVIFVRLLYYLQLVDAIAPLINTFLIIIYDIRWFLIILMIIMFAFANAFYLIGKNQIAVDEIPLDDDNYPEYSTFINAMHHVFLLALGEFNMDMYKAGNGSQQKYLFIMFYLACFLLIIHMLNMLIAIMGETFGKYNETADVQRTKSHLIFIMDNYWMDPIKDKKQIRYIIAAFFKEDDREESQILMELLNDQRELRTLLKVSVEKINDKLNKLIVN